MISWNPADDFNAVKNTSVLGGDCLAGTEVLIRDATPVFVTPSDRYDS